MNIKVILRTLSFLQRCFVTFVRRYEALCGKSNRTLAGNRHTHDSCWLADYWRVRVEISGSRGKGKWMSVGPLSLRTISAPPTAHARNSHTEHSCDVFPHSVSCPPRQLNSINHNAEPCVAATIFQRQPTIQPIQPSTAIYLHSASCVEPLFHLQLILRHRQALADTPSLPTPPYRRPSTGYQTGHDECR